MVGMLATAKAGHDKDQLYIIIEETGDSVWLADGKYKTMQHLKRKNKKHIQIWKKQTPLLLDIREKLMQGEPVRDEEIKRAMKLLIGSELEE
nr:KOW domain-containing RNA-binding protein [Lachnospiraceae bacterium]